MSIGEIIFIAIVFYIIYCIIKSIKKKQEENARKWEARNNRINEHYSRIESYREGFINTISSFFKNRTSYGPFYDSGKDFISRQYEGAYNALRSNIDGIQRENVALGAESARPNKEVVKELEIKADQFKEFGDRILATTFKTMVNPAEYGKIDMSYWKTINKKQSDQFLNDVNSWLTNAETEKFRSIQPNKILTIAWYYAIQIPYSTQKFNNARDIFCGIYRREFADLTIAEFYAIKQMGGGNVLRDRVNTILKDNVNKKIYDTEELIMIASGLAWMKAYEEEILVLQHLLNTGQQMPPKAQERLYLLSNGGGNAPSVYDVRSSGDKLVFDVSSLAWRDEDYTGLFKKLQYQREVLNYSLAIRDEDKTLSLTQGMEAPTTESTLQKMKEVFYTEYGNTAAVSLRQCEALSGVGKESIEGILAEPKKYSQMGVLVHIAHIGTRLNIKFYTLFMPVGNDWQTQNQQAISIYKRISPDMSVWESSMKETTLKAIQQLLNTTYRSTSPIINEDYI